MENMDMEYYENHSAEYEEEMAMASEELPPEMEDSSDVPTLEEQNWGLIYHLRDNLSLLTDEQLGVVKALIEDYFGQKDSAKTRLYAEASTLHNNVEKLQQFLKRRNSDGVLLTTAMKLTNAQILLMHKQLDLEMELYNTLAARLSIFDVYLTEIDGEEVEIIR